MDERKKYRVRLDEYERGVLINSLLEMRNGLVREGKDTEPVNELPMGYCLTYIFKNTASLGAVFFFDLLTWVR